MRVIGIGNPWRGDDAVGLFVIARLRELGFPDELLHQLGANTSALLDLFQRDSEIVIVDAATGPGVPGTLHCFNAIRERLPAIFPGHVNHDLSLVAAIELGRSLHRLPASLTVWGIIGGHFGHGSALSVPVRRAAELLARRLHAVCPVE